jgi:hypothetical protein
MVKKNIFKRHPDERRGPELIEINGFRIPLGK